MNMQITPHRVSMYFGNELKKKKREKKKQMITQKMYDYDVISTSGAISSKDKVQATTWSCRKIRGELDNQTYPFQ